MITKDEVVKAINDLNLEKADLNSANGAADGSGDDESLKAPGDDMSDEVKDKKKKGDDSMKSMKNPPEDFYKGLPPEVETKVEVSDFLRSLVDHNARCIDSLRDCVIKSDISLDNKIVAMSEQFDTAMANIGIVLKSICERIGVVENRAEVQKSVTGARGSQPVERSFNEPAMPSDDNSGMYKSLVGKPPHLQKSMITQTLCDLVRKGEAQDLDVINFETYNYLSPELDSKLRAVL